MAIDAAGNLYIADTGNNRVQEVAAATGTQWGQAMTAGDIYTIAGSRRTGGQRRRRRPGRRRHARRPDSIAVDPSGDLYIADSAQQPGPGNRRRQRHPVGPVDDRRRHLHRRRQRRRHQRQRRRRRPGHRRADGHHQSVSLDPDGDLYITDNANDTIREVASAIPAAIPPAPGQTSALALAPSGDAPGG